MDTTYQNVETITVAIARGLIKDTDVQYLWNGRSIQYLDKVGNKIECGFQEIIESIKTQIKSTDSKNIERIITLKQRLNATKQLHESVNRGFFSDLYQVVFPNLGEMIESQMNELDQLLKKTISPSAVISSPVSENPGEATSFFSDGALVTLDSLARIGEPIFDDASKWKMLLKNIDKYPHILEGYGEYPYITKALHEYVMVNFDQFSSSDLIAFFCKHKDKEGITLLIDSLGCGKLDDKKIIDKWIQVFESALKLRDISAIKFFSQFVSLEKIYPQKLVETAYLSSDIDTIQFIAQWIPLALTQRLFTGLHLFELKGMQEFMIQQGYLPTERERLMMDGEFLRKMVEENPILEEYGGFPDKSMGSSHIKNYGPLEAHNTFLKVSYESVLIVFYEILRLRRSGSPQQNKNAFRNLLYELGERRYFLARLCGTEEPELFGLPNSSGIETILLDNRQNPDNPYKYHINKLEPYNSVKIKIGPEEYELTMHLKDRVRNVYRSFWDKDDAVFLLTEEIFNKIVYSSYDNKSDFQKDLAYFEWLFVNIVPYTRGSASVNEVLVDPFWLSHEYIPQVTKGLDIKAQTSIEFESFLEIYARETQNFRKVKSHS